MIDILNDCLRCEFTIYTGLYEDVITQLNVLIIAVLVFFKFCSFSLVGREKMYCTTRVGR